MKRTTMFGRLWRKGLWLVTVLLATLLTGLSPAAAAGSVGPRDFVSPTVYHPARWG